MLRVLSRESLSSVTEKFYYQKYFCPERSGIKMKENKQVPEFSPYTDNGGTVVGISGKDYVVIASDTRLSTGYQIYDRNQPKLFQLTDKTVLASTGCWCDALGFSKVIEIRVKNYRYEHNCQMSTPACAQLVSTMLYYKRFFPYYISNIVAGLDENGAGCLYHYDPIGHCEKIDFTVAGSSSALIQPFLDNRVGLWNIQGLKPGSLNLPVEEATKIIKDVFVSAGERDIYVGDSVLLRIITANGIKEETYNLRKD